MGYKDHDPCLDRAEPDEPIFVGLGRDPLAAVMTAVWAALSDGVQPDGQVNEAKEHSARMMAYCLARNPGRRSERLTTAGLGHAISLLQAMYDELDPPLWLVAGFDDEAEFGAQVLTDLAELSGEDLDG